MATTNFVDGTVVQAAWLNDVDAHVYDQTTGAHTAANITFTPTGTIAATTVQAAIAEIASESLVAANIAYTPTGTVAATNVQTAIDEVAAETVQKTGDTGSAKMPSGTTAQRDGSPSAGWTRWNSTLSCNETYSGTEWVPEGWQELSTFASTSGTSNTFSSIPAYIKELRLLFKGVSSSSSGQIRIRLGTSSGLVTTGYSDITQYINLVSGTSGSIVTSGFLVQMGTSSVLANGPIMLTKYGTDWFIGGILADTGVGGTMPVNGSLALGGALTQLEVAITSGAFSAGAISLLGRA